MKFQLLVFFLALPLIIFSQNHQGKIVYIENTKMEINMPEEHREQLKSIFPDTRSTSKVLLFTPTESIYKNQEGQEDNVVETGSEESGIHTKIIIETPDNQLYKNLKEKEIYEKQEFFGRDFLVTGDMEVFQWKLILEEKDILGYTCQKAVFEDEENKVVAWYTPQIPVPNGPMHYGQLPGMILELEINNGKTHLLASEITLDKLEQGVIEKPKKGKKVGREEFEKIVSEKMKEMEEEYGNKGGNQIIIKTIQQ